MTLFLLHFCLDILANIKSGKFPPAFCFYSTYVPILFFFFLVLCLHFSPLSALKVIPHRLVVLPR